MQLYPVPSPDRETPSNLAGSDGARARSPRLRFRARALARDSCVALFSRPASCYTANAPVDVTVLTALAVAAVEKGPDVFAFAQGSHVRLIVISIANVFSAVTEALRATWRTSSFLLKTGATGGGPLLQRWRFRPKASAQAPPP